MAPGTHRTPSLLGLLALRNGRPESQQNVGTVAQLLLCTVACWVTIHISGVSEVHAFTSSPSTLFRRLTPAARTQRHFFEKLNPEFWSRENFVCGALDSYLPPARKGALYNLMEIEPNEAKYWAYLKPLDRGDHIDAAYAVFRNYDGVDDNKMKTIDASAKSLGASCAFVVWRGSVWQDLPANCIDIMLVSDGGLKRISSCLANGLACARKAMKDTGRFFFVATEEDEAVVGRLENDFNGVSPMDKFGFKIVASQRDHGVVVGYMKKKKSISKKVLKKKKPRRIY